MLARHTQNTHNLLATLRYAIFAPAGSMGNPHLNQTVARRGMNERTSHIEAIGLAVAGFTLWVFADSTIKVIGKSNLPAYEVIAFMGLIICVCLAAWTLARGEGRALWPTQPRRQLARSCLDLTN